jgi:hypothetical protein
MVNNSHKFLTDDQGYGNGRRTNNNTRRIIMVVSRPEPQIEQEEQVQIILKFKHGIILFCPFR